MDLRFRTSRLELFDHFSLRTERPIIYEDYGWVMIRASSILLQDDTEGRML